MPQTEQLSVSFGDSHFEISNCPDSYQRVRVHNITIDDVSGDVGYCDDHHLSGAAKEAVQAKFARKVAINAVTMNLQIMLEDREHLSYVERAVIQAAINIIESNR